MRRVSNAFTLAELLVSITILTLLVLFASRLVNSAAVIASLGHRRMDADSQARPILDRMALDLSHMVRRTDIDYSLKSSSDPQPGNDRMAFFCNTPGYYPSTGAQSPVSLVAYRINSNGDTPLITNRMERLDKGLLWNGVSVPKIPMVFGLGTIATNWPAAISSSASDADFELVGPQTFRLEYFYLLKTGVISDQPGGAGLTDVAALAVEVAVIDQKSRVLLTDSQLTTLSGRLKDFDAARPANDLVASWQATVDGVTDMPRLAINGVRIYQRYFYLR